MAAQLDAAFDIAQNFVKQYPAVVPLTKSLLGIVDAYPGPIPEEEEVWATHCIQSYLICWQRNG